VGGGGFFGGERKIDEGRYGGGAQEINLSWSKRGNCDAEGVKAGVDGHCGGGSKRRIE